MKKSEAKLCNTIDNVLLKRAILIAAKKTMDIFEKERIEHDDNIQERVEDSIQDEKEDPNCYRLFAEDLPEHYSDFIKQSDLIQWLKYFAIQGVWDLGCKDARFCCYCPFDKRFETYLKKIIILDEVKDHASEPCKCNNRKKIGHSYAELTQHMNTSKNWLHRM